MKNRIEILVLQHPREPKAVLGTAHLIPQVFDRVVVKTGLSWPSLKRALGREDVNPKEWAVLHLGGRLKFKPDRSDSDQIFLLDNKGNRVGFPDPPLTKTKGVVILDGTWSQAKTLWWRNAWLLKLRRLALIPAERSLYGGKRKEPRRECLSSLEAIGSCLSLLEDNLPLKAAAQDSLKNFLNAPNPQP